MAAATTVVLFTIQIPAAWAAGADCYRPAFESAAPLASSPSLISFLPYIKIILLSCLFSKMTSFK